MTLISRRRIFTLPLDEDTFRALSSAEASVGYDYSIETHFTTLYMADLGTRVDSRWAKDKASAEERAFRVYH